MPTTKKDRRVVATDQPDVVDVPDGTRIIEFKQNHDTFRVEVEDKYRFTFGPFAPGAKAGYGGADLALRIYEGANKDNQVAVFRGVESVRDLSVKLFKKIRVEDGERRHKINADGSESDEVLTVGEDWVTV
jgi:hypothetical protein